MNDIVKAPGSQITQALTEQKSRFLKLDAANGKLLDFQQECLFAHQQLMKSERTARAAMDNLGSLKAAIMNVAAIGISLNPATQHAYFVPRDGRICLDISYRGLVKLATDAGAIAWAKAELVYERDQFTYRGPSTQPHHEADVFGERGELKGGYVVAKLVSGDLLIETMPVAEIHKIRDTSKAFKAGGGPWKDWHEEMCKKTLIKRAYKSWPQTAGRLRLDKAVETLNEHEGMAYTLEQKAEFLRLLRAGDALGFTVFFKSLNESAMIGLYNSFEPGEKMADKKRVNELSKEGRQQLDDVIDRVRECAQADDEVGVEETIGHLSEPVREAVMSKLPPDISALVDELRQRVG